MASALRTSLCQTLRKRDAPEAARCAALQGAELLVYPTAIGNVDSCVQPTGHWQEAWEISQRAHAKTGSALLRLIKVPLSFTFVRPYFTR